jgi:hypothetical protein
MMIHPFIHAASRLALILALCIGFIGGALLLSHAHLYRAEQPADAQTFYQNDLPPIYQNDLPPLW